MVVERYLVELRILPSCPLVGFKFVRWMVVDSLSNTLKNLFPTQILSTLLTRIC